MSITKKWTSYDKKDIDKNILYDVKAGKTILCNVRFFIKDKYCKEDNYFMQGHNAFIKEQYITQIRLNKN
jgi:hypothetical protein